MRDLYSEDRTVDILIWVTSFEKKSPFFDFFIIFFRLNFVCTPLVQAAFSKRFAKKNY